MSGITLLALLAATAAIPGNAGSGGPAIPPGQEQIVARMLGRGATLAGGCRLTEAAIEPRLVRAQYTCAETDSPVIVELRHPTGAPDEALRTEQFAIVFSEPIAVELIEDLRSRVTRHESAWQWKTVGERPSPPHAFRAWILPHFGFRWLPLILPLAAFVLAGLALQLRPPPSRADVVTFIALLGVAAIARLGLGVWGPHHVNGQGPLWILHTLSSRPVLHGYGPGYAELFWWARLVAPADPDTAVFATNALLSTLSVPVLFALARALGLDRTRALLPAALLAVDCVSIRFAATEAYFPSIIALSIAGGFLVVRGAGDAVTAQRWRAAALNLSAALLLCQAIRVHPVGWLPAALVPLLAVAVPGAHSTTRRVRLALAAYAVAGAAVLLTSGVVVADAGEVAAGKYLFEGAAHWLPRQGVAPIMWAVGAGVTAALFCRPRWVALPAFAGLLAMLLTDHIYGQSLLWQHSYQRLFAWMPALAVGAVLPRRRGWAATATALCVTLAAVTGAPTARARTTEQLEYAWFRHAFVASPAGCRIAWVSRAASRILALPTYAVPGVAPAYANTVGDDQLTHPSEDDACILYARTSLCTSIEGRAQCDRVERSLSLRKISEVSLPAVPSFDELPYDRDTVRPGLYRVLSAGRDGSR